jgi:putative ABC transport system ATP-binding protein
MRADGSGEVLTTVGPGNYFGEIGPMLNLPRSATARAKGATRLTSMTIRSFRQHFPLTVKEARGPRD